MINFLKKYPMSILLAIIALNLFSISNTLRDNGKLERDKQLCAADYAFGGADQWNKEGKGSYKSTLKKMGLPNDTDWISWYTAYCKDLKNNW